MRHTLNLALAVLGVAAAMSLTPDEARPLVHATMSGDHRGKSVDILASTDIDISRGLLQDGKLLLGDSDCVINSNCFHIALVKLDTLYGGGSYGRGAEFLSQGMDLEWIVQGSPDSWIGTPVRYCRTLRSIDLNKTLRGQHNTS